LADAQILFDANQASQVDHYWTTHPTHKWLLFHPSLIPSLNPQEDLKVEAMPAAPSVEESSLHQQQDLP